MTAIKPQGASMNLSGGQRLPVKLNEVAVVLRPTDDIAVAKISLLPGTVLIMPDGGELRVAQMVPMGHKIATRHVPVGQPVHKYGQIIGFATQEILPGHHVHTQNVGTGGDGSLTLDYAFSEDYKPVDLVPESERRTFMGFRRPDGRVGTRNFVAILASVNCASSATVAIADYFRQPGVMDAYPNVDGVLPLPHKGGCGAHIGSRDLHIFQRTLAGMVQHPNVAAYVVLSLGCEVNQPVDMMEYTGMDSDQPTVLTIQQDGGYSKTVELGHRSDQAAAPDLPMRRRASPFRRLNSTSRSSAAAPTAGRA